MKASFERGEEGQVRERRKTKTRLRSDARDEGCFKELGCDGHEAEATSQPGTLARCTALDRTAPFPLAAQRSLAHLGTEGRWMVGTRKCTGHQSYRGGKIKVPNHDRGGPPPNMGQLSLQGAPVAIWHARSQSLTSKRSSG